MGPVGVRFGLRGGLLRALAGADWDVGNLGAGVEGTVRRLALELALESREDPAASSGNPCKGIKACCMDISYNTVISVVILRRLPVVSFQTP